jgi:hypothetical protein
MTLPREETANTPATREVSSKASGRAGRTRRLEFISTLLLSAATVLTSWSAYQSSRWSGDQATEFSQASASRTESVRASTLAGQQTIADVSVFTAWLTAADEGHVHLADLLASRFRGEFKVAFEAWEATSPLTNPSAPATPFALPQYESASTQEATHLEARASSQFNAATEANGRADDYVLMTLLFSLVLFFGAISTRFELVAIQTSMVCVAGAVFVAATAITATLPVNI